MKIGMCLLASCVLWLFPGSSGVCGDRTDLTRATGEPAPRSAQPSAPGTEGRDRTGLRTAALRVPFTGNMGHIKDESVRFTADIQAGRVFLTDDGATYALFDGQKEDRKGWVLKETLINARRTTALGLQPSSVRVSSFIGNDPTHWQRNLPVYDDVGLGEVYEGIRLRFAARGAVVEKIFDLDPGANPERIEVKIEGAGKLAVNNAGELEIETGIGTFKMSSPVAYQEIDGKRAAVEVAYRLNPEESSYGFTAGVYDKSLPLVIDPSLLASTYIGGSSTESGQAIVFARDGSGDIYVTGQTTSADYPGTPGAYQPTHEPATDPGCGDCEYDVYVSRFSSDLKTLVASTFIGGTYVHAGSCATCNYEVSHAIAVDGSGNVYIAGETTAVDYPTTDGAYQRTHDDVNGTNADGFISVFSGDLSALIASTYFGTWSHESISGMAFDSPGKLLVAGTTSAQGELIPPESGWDTGPKHPGTNNGFVARFEPDLSTLLAGTYIGGSAGDNISAMALDTSGNIFIAGSTTSSDYPTTAGAYRATPYGNADGYVSKFDPTLQQLLASTYLGGVNHNDYISSMAVDSTGNVFVAGQTQSNDFPATPGAFDTSYNLHYDAFVSKLNNALSNLQASTFLGGAAWSDWASAIALDAAGNVYVTGGTGSSDFPLTSDAYNTTFNQGVYGYNAIDVFVAELDASLKSLVYSTYIGGTTHFPELNSEAGQAIALDSSANVVISGYTTGADWPVTADAFDTTWNGGSDAFVTKLEIPHTLSVKSIGSSILNPGKTGTYLIKYKNGMNVAAKGVILKMTLPGQVHYVSSTGNGIVRGDRREVFWKLGSLARNATGDLFLTVYVPWGTPDSELSLTGSIDALNAEADIIPDIADYLDYEPVHVASNRFLSAEEITDLLATDSKFKDLYDYGLGLGFKSYGVAKETGLSTGESLLQLIMLKPSPLEALFVRRTNGFEYVLVKQTAQNTLEYLDTTGGLFMDFKSGVQYTWGAWSEEPAESLSVGQAPDAAAPCTAGKCWRNCMIENAANIAMDVVLDPIKEPYRTGLFVLQSSWAMVKYIFKQDDDSGHDCAMALADQPENKYFDDYPGLIKGAITAINCPSLCATTANRERYCCQGEKRECSDFDRAAIAVTSCSSWGIWGLMSSYRRCAVGYVCNAADPTIDGCIKDPCDKEGAAGKTKMIDCRKFSILPAHDPNAKSVDVKGNIVAGQQLTYTIDYENTGAGTAYEVYILDTLDPDLNQDTLLINNGGSYAKATRTLMWYIGELAPGGKGSVSFGIKARTGLAEGTTVSNTAQIYFPSADELTPTNPVVNIVQSITATPKTVEAMSGVSESIVLTGKSSSPATTTYRITSDPRYGSITGAPPRILYKSMNGFSGQDEFSFAAHNGSLESEPAAVTVNVSPNPSDSVPPKVTQTYPETNAQSVAIGKTSPTPGSDRFLPTIRAIFSESMDPAGITPETFTVAGLTGIVSYDEPTRTATFSPTVALLPSTTYTARLSAGIADKVGNPLAAEYSWSFSTQSPANIVAALPDGGSVIDWKNIAVGSTGVRKTITVTNTGSMRLVLKTVAIPVNQEDSFRIAEDNCSDKILATMQSCTLGLEFAPSSKGIKSAALVIPSNDPDTRNIKVALKGTGVLDLPDLTGVWQLNKLTCGASWCTVKGAFVVRNKGTKPAAASLLQISLSDNPKRDTTDISWREEVDVLNPGQSQEIPLFFTVPFNAVGDYLIAFTDCTRKVQEANETNNTVVSKSLE